MAKISKKDEIILAPLLINALSVVELVPSRCLVHRQQGCGKPSLYTVGKTMDKRNQQLSGKSIDRLTADPAQKRKGWHTNHTVLFPIVFFVVATFAVFINEPKNVNANDTEFKVAA